MKLKDCRLWDGSGHKYIYGYAFAITCVGTQEFDKETEVEMQLDWHFIEAADCKGLRHLLYWAPDGFKKIVLTET